MTREQRQAREWCTRPLYIFVWHATKGDNLYATHYPGEWNRMVEIFTARGQAFDIYEGERMGLQARHLTVDEFWELPGVRAYEAQLL